MLEPRADEMPNLRYEIWAQSCDTTIKKNVLECTVYLKHHWSAGGFRHLSVEVPDDDPG